MLRSTASKVMWVGRTAAAVFGLALVLALVFGVATMALAAVPGDPFKLGERNVISVITKLKGSVAGPNLLITNTSDDPAATGLSLNVKDGKAPLIVANPNSGKATNLNADQIDGLDSTQLPHGFYEVVQVFTQASPANGFAAGEAFCDAGDKVVGGGYGDLHPTSHVATDSPSSGASETQSGWVITWKTLDPNTTDTVAVYALCADFGAPHP
jgi:hypothetical protein